MEPNGSNMSDNKKYYYMRLKENFFDTNEMKILESLQDGYKYSNILLKLYLMSLPGDGKLMINDRIPYNTQMIATITRHSVGDVEKALRIFRDLGLIEVLESGAIYMLDIQNYIGKSSTEADRQRSYQNRITTEKCKNSNKLSNKISTPKIEIEKEIKLNKETTTKVVVKKKRQKFVKPTKQQVEEYCRELNVTFDADKFIDYYESKGWYVGKSPMKDWKATLRNWLRQERKLVSSSERDSTLDDIF